MSINVKNTIWKVKQNTGSPAFEVKFSEDNTVHVGGDDEFFGGFNQDNDGNLTFSIADPNTIWAGNQPSVTGYYASAADIEEGIMKGFAAGTNGATDSASKFVWTATRV